MGESAESLPPTTEAFLEELRRWKVSFSSSVQMMFQGVELIEKLLEDQLAGKGGTAAAAATEGVLRVRHEDVVALDSLKVIGKDFFHEARRRLAVVTNGYYQIDLSRFFQGAVQGVGQTIRLFCPVTPEDFQKELFSFLTGTNTADGLRLFLKIGTDVNGLLGGQTALLMAVCADSMEAVQMIVEDGGADLEVKALPQVNEENQPQKDEGLEGEEEQEEEEEEDEGEGETRMMLKGKMEMRMMMRRKRKRKMRMPLSGRCVLRELETLP
uniref:Uncharacterized protein n=1 Tax=Chromera velia CCMP2878 TaxID=1169474 RepID=A0A0G4H9R1_9ALVE|eukprot:Cvel_25455.t1-p1 / transcript=Cvel_25455.t1 / gene=Cvel_25455 / organism=Chromera_velia_CCMP2878 / gene_product=hypothetical protein / transcript_product=hypothetical protein / location=Cvel_scaffold2887:1499-2302(-) / protein_length=268 / sequence_SO=supercontig / SO=protein_coding / is_pseudo=false